MSTKEYLDPAARNSRAAAIFGQLFPLELTMLWVVDWWFPVEADSSALRFWPHIFRAAFAFQLVAYIVLHAKQTSKLRVARFQFLWLSVLTARFVLYGDFGSTVVLYMSAYAFCVLVLWVGYSLVVDGHVTARQVAVTGTIMTSLLVMRMVLYRVAGVFVGNELSEHEGVIVNAAYPMLWFLLMQMLDTTVPMTKVVGFSGVVAVVMTLKRGAFIAMLLGAITYGVTYAYIHRKARGVQRVVAIGAIVATVLGLSVWSRSAAISERWQDLADPMQAGSGREIFWAIIGQHWLNATPLIKLIGFGPHTVFDLTAEQWFAAVPAHDDWLMLLHEFGMLGIVTFLLILWAFLTSAPRVIRQCPSLAPVFCAAIAAASVVTVFDLFSYNIETAFFGLLVAVPLGLAERSSLVVLPSRHFVCRRLHRTLQVMAPHLRFK